MPRLSFIIPIYQPDIVIFEKCLKSLEDQAFKDFEVIAVLDGPCPETRLSLDKFARKISLKIVDIEHGGAPRARNEGAKHASGDFWVFWDADCVIEPGASSVWVQIFDKKSEVGFVYSGYKFFGNQYCLDSESFDPWTLRVRNYISTCFPFRKELFPGWKEQLKSLQDWDFWLSLVESAESKGWDASKIGHYLRGYAFSTAHPTPKSISGEGCTRENWLERMDAVRDLHGIAKRDTCVSSLQYRHDGIRLAKLIGADYQDIPNDKPHHYEKIIQVGFSPMPGIVERHSTIFSEKDVRKFLFWTGDNINELYNNVSFQAVSTYSKILNETVAQFVEDKQAEQLMSLMGFKVRILPMPMTVEGEPSPLPEKPMFAFDLDNNYGQSFVSIERSLPDVEIVALEGQQPINKYTGVFHFYADRSMSSTLKRAILAGRHVVSNVRQPFCGFVDDSGSQERFIEGVVGKARSIIGTLPNPQASEYYKRALGPSKLLEAIS